MTKWVAAAVLVAVCAAAFGAAAIWFGGVGLAAARSNVLTFVDPFEDSSSAADISTVRAENDDAGQFTIRITLANRPQLLVQDRMTVYLDTDRDDRSGDSNGADFFFVLAKTASSTTADVCRWTGTPTLDCSIPSTTFRASFNAAQVVFTVNRSELGNTTGIGIIVRTYDNNDVSHFDRAPDAGTREYEFPFVISSATTSSSSSTATTTVTTVTDVVPGLRVGNVVLSPKKPKAGKTLTASVSTRSAASGASVRAGSISCRAKIGKASARLASKRTAMGAASCTWRLPKSAKGKRISSTIVVTGNGLSTARSFVAAIR